MNDFNDQLEDSTKDFAETQGPSGHGHDALKVGTQGDSYVGGGGQPHHPDSQSHEPRPRREVVQYPDGQCALSLTGELGTTFDFQGHKWSPTDLLGEGVVKTRSGNDYYIFTSDQTNSTYILNTNVSREKGTPEVDVRRKRPVILPPVEFGRPWEIPGFYTTTPVTEVLLKYTETAPGQEGYKQIDKNPFEEYKNILRRKSPNNT